MVKPAKHDAYPTISFASQKEWRAWLSKNHKTAPGIWLKYAKKDSGIASIRYAEALDVALCYGWIDGQAKGVDDTWYLQKYTPRGPRSIWSQINRIKVQALIDSGQMRAAGLAEVERAQKDGRWDAAYASPKNATVPDDLMAALNKSARAKKFFESLNSTNRYAILHRLQTAKKPETRAARLEKFIAMLKAGEKIHP